MAIVPIFGVKLDEEDNVFELFSKEEFISEMEKTRKIEDGKYLLISTEAKKSRSQVEVDSILDEFFTNASSERSSSNPTRYKISLVHNHFSIYVTALSNTPVPKTDEQYLHYLPLKFQRPNVVSFAASKTDSSIATFPPRLQKYKVTNDHSSIITQTTIDSTQMLIAQDSTPNIDLNEKN